MLAICRCNSQLERERAELLLILIIPPLLLLLPKLFSHAGSRMCVFGEKKREERRKKACSESESFYPSQGQVIRAISSLARVCKKRLPSGGVVNQEGGRGREKGVRYQSISYTLCPSTPAAAPALLKRKKSAYAPPPQEQKMTR